MALIRTDSNAALRRRGDRYTRALLREMRAVAGEVAAELTEPVDVDDLVSVTDRWNARVDATLAPELEGVWRETADDVADQVQRAANDLAKRRGETAAAAPEPGAFVVPQVRNELAETYLGSRRSFLVNVGVDLWESMREQLLVGLEAGESIGDLGKRVIGAVAFTAARAERVARTEVVGASNAGSMAQMREIDLPATKTWLATGGPRTRETHAAANGQTVDVNEQFTVGGTPMDRPHAEGAPADEVVNCRCTVTFEIADEAFEQSRSPDGRFGPGDGGDDVAGGNETDHQYVNADTMQLSNDEAERIAGKVDSLSTATRGDEDIALKDLAAKNNFDGRPELVDNDVLDERIDAGWTELYRGMGSTTEEGNRFADQFKSGDYFAGFGTNGNGTYTAFGDQAKSVADNYGSTTVRMALRPDAKIVDSSDLFSEMFTKTATMSTNERKIALDFGRYATMQGYDAINLGNPKYMVVLNRTALAVAQ